VTDISACHILDYNAARNGVLIPERNTVRYSRVIKACLHGFLPITLGFMALTGDILGKQDIPLTKPPFLAAAHLNLSSPFKGDNIFPADNIVTGIVILCRDLPEKEGLYSGWLGKKTQGATGFQLNLNFIKMGLVILPGI
jgi:hypothetical protein